MRKGILFALLVCCLACASDDTPEIARALDFEDLERLSQDTRGVHRPISLINSGSHYGYYFYEPSGYQTDEEDYPVLIYLHSAEGFTRTGSERDLDLVLQHGPPRKITEGTWNPRYPMLVVSPQLKIDDLDWEPNKLQDFIEYLEETYRINSSRIYITGIGLGGRGIFDYLVHIGSRQKAAAVIPIAGKGSPIQARSVADVPIWAFHGEEDRVIPLDRGSQAIIEAINANERTTRALLTTYPGVGHDAWTITYNGMGIGRENTENDRFLESIYDWMFDRKSQ